MIQTLMLQLISESFWTRLLSHCCKTTARRSEIVSYQCLQHDSRQQKKALTWNCLSWLAYLPEFLTLLPYKTEYSHTAGTCFLWCKDVPCWNPKYSLDATSNIQIYGMLSRGARLRALQVSPIIVIPPTGFPGVRSIRPILSWLHAVRHQLLITPQPRYTISQERRGAFLRQYIPIPGKVILHICDWRFYILFWRHGTEILDTFQLHIEKWCSKVYVRIFYFFALEFEIFLNPFYRFQRVVLNA